MTGRSEEDYRDASGTIMMCMYCLRTRRNSREGSEWELVEEFLANRPRGVSHGLCPDCLEKHYPME